ncbi:glutathione peroxidase [Kerstersia gyiorum]|uniref:glutathione peroxidase n=1 Tax=Kerstersia gyiorum TaxID=206506 RepID=UPI00209C8BEE|nr:glutathione peroxidase [Kerstersia gyiorum]MCP1680612.1 glutathione peroxidase [Kerstersia gyiorum]MCP1825148.1 glutathione peroxidase [Kerstersia gyiorum]MCP1828564.1 glutathione peroxidase [Kerstersia gyiorum]MCW2452167.1 glutathione peroxidase [Kerstersia gyiorum]
MSEKSIYDIPLQRLDGSAATLGDYRGKALLIVNVASQCGLTPQYAGLESLYEQYKEQGLEVLGFPCNDFAGQEPGSADEIKTFCEGTFGVRFPLFAKVVINGAGRHPLYAALIAARPAAQQKPDGTLRQRLADRNLLSAEPSDVTWNFEKFLVSRSGEVIGRFAPDIAPDDPALRQTIDAALA